MELFRRDNTDGYSAAELAALNREWQERVKALGLDPHDDEYDLRAKQFSDEVSRR